MHNFNINFDNKMLNVFYARFLFQFRKIKTHFDLLISLLNNDNVTLVWKRHATPTQPCASSTTSCLSFKKACWDISICFRRHFGCWFWVASSVRRVRRTWRIRPVNRHVLADKRHQHDELLTVTLVSKH